MATKIQKATFGAGCFWCVEAVLEQLDGVLDVTSGYMGGDVPEPSYEQVCTGQTGHAEAVQVEFDPAQVSYGDLLKVFWDCHDPTTLNRQGPDVGTQYRSAIFTHTPDQVEAALESKEALFSNGVQVVTEVVAAGEYWPAEDYHQQYFEKAGGRRFGFF